MKNITTIVVPLIKGYWLMLQDSLSDPGECVDFYLKHERYGDWHHVFGLPYLFDGVNQTPIDLQDEESVKAAIRFFRLEETEHILEYHEMMEG